MSFDFCYASFTLAWKWRSVSSISPSSYESAIFILLEIPKPSTILSINFFIYFAMLCFHTSFTRKFKIHGLISQRLRIKLNPMRIFASHIQRCIPLFRNKERIFDIDRISQTEDYHTVYSVSRIDFSTPPFCW